jgi:hypothetical protein
MEADGRVEVGAYAANTELVCRPSGFRMFKLYGKPRARFCVKEFGEDVEGSGVHEYPADPESSRKDASMHTLVAKEGTISWPDLVPFVTISVML